MADSEIENSFGFVDRRKSQGNSALGWGGGSIKYNDVNQLRAKLAAAAPASYPSKTLDSMTKNDMVYAVRLLEDAAGI